MDDEWGEPSTATDGPYECDGCGLCCRKLIIEIQHIDVVREPRLLDHARLCDGHGRIVFNDPYKKQYMLACGEAKSCGFLTPENRCAIYPTRPNVCVGFDAGSPKCQGLREQAGLPRLQPTGAIP